MEFIAFINPLKSLCTVVNDGPDLAFRQFLARFNLISERVRPQLVNHEQGVALNPFLVKSDQMSVRVPVVQLDLLTDEGGLGQGKVLAL
jgi:hypothetical protein